MIYFMKDRCKDRIFGMNLFSSQLDSYEIKPGKTLKVNISVPNLRLFVGNIPKSRGKEEILEEFGKLTGKVKNRTEGVG
jgi:hypothetical protein